MKNVMDKCEVLSFLIENQQKTAMKLNNDAKEDELHSTRQGLSNKSTGHDVE